MKKIFLRSDFLTTYVFQIVFFLIFFFLLGINEISSQNIGIGITNPTRAKLEVSGVAGSGATSAIFGSDGTGISLQRNWPTIGFNQYRDAVTPGSQGKYIATGYASIQYFDPTTGYMAFDMFTYGTANTFTPLAKRAISILPSGNVGILSGGSSTTSLYVVKANNFDGAAIFAGTQHGSYFSYSNAENSYIRGGRDGSDVYINDIPNGNILLGGGSSKVGINEFNPVTSLQLNGAIALNPGNVSISNTNYAINVGNLSYIIVTKLDPDATFATISNGIVRGQILVIESAQSNGSSGFQIFDGNNLRLAGDPVLLRLKGLDTIMLMWNGTYWLEISHSENFD